MAKTSYIVYITKSQKAAKAISDGLRANMAQQEYDEVGCGAVGNDERVPALFHNQELYFAFAAFKDDYVGQTYELIIC